MWSGHIEKFGDVWWVEVHGSTAIHQSFGTGSQCVVTVTFGTDRLGSGEVTGGV